MGSSFNRGTAIRTVVGAVDNCGLPVVEKLALLFDGNADRAVLNPLDL